MLGSCLTSFVSTRGNDHINSSFCPIGRRYPDESLYEQLTCTWVLGLCRRTAYKEYQGIVDAAIHLQRYVLPFSLHDKDRS